MSALATNPPEGSGSSSAILDLEDSNLEQVMTPRDAFFAETERWAAVRDADALPPILPPFFAEAFVSGTPRPLPDLLPPPDSLLTVAHARRSASPSGTPRFS